MPGKPRRTQLVAFAPDKRQQHDDGEKRCTEKKHGLHLDYLSFTMKSRQFQETIGNQKAP
jgi:hypothetical protein